MLRDLLRYAIGEGASGIVLHLNNLENLSEADASRAADLLRGIRDQAPPSARKVDAFLFKSLGGLMEQLNDCLQPCCSS